MLEPGTFMNSLLWLLYVLSSYLHSVHWVTKWFLQF